MPRVAAEKTNRFPMPIPAAGKAGQLGLDEEQTRFVLDLLDNPPEPNAKLLRAAQALTRT